MPSVTKSTESDLSVSSLQQGCEAATSSPMKGKLKSGKAKQRRALSSRIKRLFDSKKDRKKKKKNAINENSDFDQYIALDCEMVGVGPCKRTALARCTVIDYHGNCLYDSYVKPSETVTDYRTRWSGIRKEHIEQGVPFEKVRDHMTELMQGKILIGHAIHNDLKALQITHPAELIRDTSKCLKIRNLMGIDSMQGLALRTLSKQLLHREIQKGEHCSLEDATATMDLFKLAESQSDSQSDHQSKPSLLHTFMNDVYWPVDFDNQ
ncbi:interferon-stimulated gene 20 kDa protein-like [Glandiceps talaboti]